MKENFVKVWFGVIAALVILPFLFVAFFNYPSTDDFVFAYKVKSMGFFQAQYDWYVHWTGRFFSTFILSLHPLVFNSNILYKLYAITLMLLTLHAIYRFVKLIFKNKPTYIILFFTCLLTGVYLNNMPILVQGIYWMPGAITYQLANILLLHFFVNIINDNKNINRWKYYILNAILIIAICGSNETSMVVVFVGLILFLFYKFIINKIISKKLMFFISIVIVCSTIVLVAPGNFIRNNSFNEVDLMLLVNIILQSFYEGIQLFISWWLSWEIFILSFLFIVIKNQSIIKTPQIRETRWLVVVFVIISLFLMIAASVSLSLWYGGELLPRALNVSYWIFLIGWISLLNELNELISIKFKVRINRILLTVVPFTILIVFVFSKNNYSLTVSDILSSKVFTYRKEMNNRQSIIEKSSKSRISIPSLSAYPNSVFYLESSYNGEDYFNKKMAVFYKKHTIKLNFIPSKLDATYNVNMDDEFSYSLQNNHTITNEAALSKPNSCLLSPQQQYSVIFQEKIYKINTENFKTAYISSNIYSSSDTVDLAVVFIVENRKKELIKWQGKDIVSTRYKVNKWNKEEVFFYLDDRKLLNKYNIIKAYIWNRGKNKVYIDDLVISFF